MADTKQAHADDHSDHHDDGAVHVHIHSIKFYGAILGTLILLTVLTIGTSLVDIDGFVQPGTPQGAGGFNLALAMVIATIKAGFVVTFFMHLRDDSRFNALVFVGSVLFAGVFLAYTLNDTGRRGQGDPYYGVHLLPTTGERAPGGVRCRFEGEEAEPGVVGLPICGVNDAAHVVPCQFAEGGHAAEAIDGVGVCIWERGTITAVTRGQFESGRVGDPAPAHEGEHAEGADGEGGEHHE